MKFFCWIILMLVMYSCEKYSLKDGNKRLPNASERGRGLFACYIDNQTYIGKNQPSVVYNKTSGYLFLENSNSNFEFRLFVFEGIFGEGDYSFDITGEDYVLNNGEQVFAIEPGGINELHITSLDLEEDLIAGTFSLDLISEQGVQKHIRDGRFDLEISVHG